MNNFKCPNCQNTINLWNFAKAPTPFHLKCDHCKQKLKLQKHSKLIIFFGVLIGVVVGFLNVFLHLPFIYFIGILAIAFIVFELVTYFVIRKLGVNFDLGERQR